MQTLKLTKADFKDTDSYYKEYCGTENVADFDGHIEIEANLGFVKFLSLKAKGHIFAKDGSGIKAGEGIEAGEGIKAGWGIEAGWGIKAGEGIKAGSGIEAGEGIKAGEGILSLRGSLRAKLVSCLRIAVGFDISTKCKIEVEESVKGEVLLGEVVKIAPREYYFHIHHEKLVELAEEPIQNRVAYIKSDKPKSEVATRLKWLTKVKDQEAVRKALSWSDLKALDSLHVKEHPGCPWNGKTIFPQLQED